MRTWSCPKSLRCPAALSESRQVRNHVETTSLRALALNARQSARHSRCGWSSAGPQTSAANLGARPFCGTATPRHLDIREMRKRGAQAAIGVKPPIEAIEPVEKQVSFYLGLEREMEILRDPTAEISGSTLSRTDVTESGSRSRRLVGQTSAGSGRYHRARKSVAAGILVARPQSLNRIARPDRSTVQSTRLCR
jgi:hypothetical protein